MVGDDGQDRSGGGVQGQTPVILVHWPRAVSHQGGMVGASRAATVPLASASAPVAKLSTASSSSVSLSFLIAPPGVA
jgi:hypothetical protein